MPYKEKLERVEKIMTQLGIKHIENSRIGSGIGSGISGGERRRVSMGMELIAAPRVLFWYIISDVTNHDIAMSLHRAWTVVVRTMLSKH